MHQADITTTLNACIDCALFHTLNLPIYYSITLIYEPMYQSNNNIL